MDVILRCHFKNEGILFHLLVKGDVYKRQDRNSYYWAFVAGKKEEEAGLYAVRRGVAVNGTTGEIEDHPAAQAVKPCLLYTSCPGKSGNSHGKESKGLTGFSGPLQ